MDPETLSLQEQVCILLNAFRFPVHRSGFKQLCIAIPAYAEDDSQCITKHIYPAIAKVLNCSDWRAVEHSIRNIITYTWENGNRAVWGTYFPDREKPPTNKLFIATIAECIKKPLPKGRD